jgi:hypothetical protein
VFVRCLLHRLVNTFYFSYQYCTWETKHSLYNVGTLPILISTSVPMHASLFGNGHVARMQCQCRFRENMGDPWESSRGAPSHTFLQRRFLEGTLMHDSLFHQHRYIFRISGQYLRDRCLHNHATYLRRRLRMAAFSGCHHIPKIGKAYILRCPKDA